MRPTRSLEDAMAALADGDRGAFDEVYGGVAPRVEAFCEKLLGLPDGADAAQESLVKLFRQATRYRRGESVLAWALTLARWECRTWRRRRQRSRELLEPRPELATSVPDETSALMSDAAISVLADLPEADRETIVAALNDMTPTGSRHRKRKQRAFERLRAAWRQRHGI